MHFPRSVSLIIFCTILTLYSGACSQSIEFPETPTPIAREAKIPADAQKITPATDDHPPELLASEYEQPIPIPGAVNTAGAEDSPFITPDGDTLYFFFTPDANIPVQQQLLDGVTGVYVSHKENDIWGASERIILQDNGKLALDGCGYVMGNVMWFCSAREGYDGIHWFKAEYLEGRWQNWKVADFPLSFQVGELHFTEDGARVYFASGKPGSKGGLDIWFSDLANGSWQEPVNVSVVNTETAEGWPALSPDGKELWFSRSYGIWRSTWEGGKWGPAEQIVSTLAGEPSIDQDGNLYFVHHFYKKEKMIEADIYLARKK